MGLFKPDKGEVIVDGENISTMDRQELSRFRTRMGMVFQSAALFDSLTVWEHLRFVASAYLTLPLLAAIPGYLMLTPPWRTPRRR